MNNKRKMKKKKKTPAVSEVLSLRLLSHNAWEILGPYFLQCFSLSEMMMGGRRLSGLLLGPTPSPRPL
jgi:hypothetical protein